MELIVNKRIWWAGDSEETSGGETKFYNFEDKDLEINKTFLISSSVFDNQNDNSEVELAIKIINKDDKGIKIEILTNDLFINQAGYMKEFAGGKNFVLNKIKMPKENKELTKEDLKNVLFLTTESMDAGADYSIYLVD